MVWIFFAGAPKALKLTFQTMAMLNTELKNIEIIMTFKISMFFTGSRATANKIRIKIKQTKAITES